MPALADVHLSAIVTIEGGGAGLASYPDMFVAQLSDINSCTVPEGVDVAAVEEVAAAEAAEASTPSTPSRLRSPDEVQKEREHERGHDTC